MRCLPLLGPALRRASVAVWLLGGCASGVPAPAPPPQAAPAPDPLLPTAVTEPLPPPHLPEAPPAPPPAPPSVSASRLESGLKRPPPPTSPQDIARAKKILERGLLLYRKGDYTQAEAVLKEAMTIYPFLAEANLALGKIFLIRGSATLDRALINNARLMFEMARTLDPSLRETEMLLELFAPPP